MAAAVAPYFNLLRRGGEWDEVFMLCPIPNKREWLAVSVDADAANFTWLIVRRRAGHHRACVFPVGLPRTAPPGIDAATVNWLCDPERLQKATFGT